MTEGTCSSSSFHSPHRRCHCDRLTMPRPGPGLDKLPVGPPRDAHRVPALRTCLVCHPASFSLFSSPHSTSPLLPGSLLHLTNPPVDLYSALRLAISFIFPSFLSPPHIYPSRCDLPASTLFLPLLLLAFPFSPENQTFSSLDSPSTMPATEE